MKNKKENKFFVLKQEDLDNYFSQYTKGVFTTEAEQKYIDQIPFNTVVKAIGNMRETEGKPRFNKYIVCNQDEPHAEEVWQTILKGEDAKNPELIDGVKE